MYFRAVSASSSATAAASTSSPSIEAKGIPNCSASVPSTSSSETAPRATSQSNGVCPSSRLASTASATWAALSRPVS